MNNERSLQIGVAWYGRKRPHPTSAQTSIQAKERSSIDVTEQPQCDNPDYDNHGNGETEANLLGSALVAEVVTVDPKYL